MTHSLLDRYQAGDHRAVYEELRTSAATGPEAHEVAAELMRRARHDLELLVQRWRARGFALEAPLAAPGAEFDALAHLEERFGPFPPTLHAFYEQIGWINFVEEPPGSPWPAIENLDPISFASLSSQLDDLDGDQPALHLFPDQLVKFDIAGVGDIYFPLAGALHGFDPALYFEGDPVELLVPYLRTTILERGGIGPACPEDDLASDLVRELTVDLVPF